MKKWVFSAILSGLLALPAFAKGPEIDLVNNKLSVDAESVSLSRLLRLLDQATGMKSKVPPELANRNISVKFSGLNLTDGVRKIFQGQPFDYVMLEGQGIIVTGASQNLTGTETVPVYTPAPNEIAPLAQDLQQQFPQPGVPQPGFPGQPPIAGQQQQPATLQTPFGAMPNPRAPQQPNGALTAPGQSNLSFSNAFSNNNAQQGAPNAQPSTPFGSPSPFNSPSQQPQNNGMFGATNLFPGSQQSHP